MRFFRVLKSPYLSQQIILNLTVQIMRFFVRFPRDKNLNRAIKNHPTSCPSMSRQKSESSRFLDMVCVCKVCMCAHLMAFDAMTRV